MKILHLNLSDSRGGAARAAYRLHEGLRNADVDSSMLVQFKTGSDPEVMGPAGKLEKGMVLARDTLEPLMVNLRGGADTEFSSAWLPCSGISSRVNRYAPDIVQLHWVGGGMLRIEDLRALRKPLVWTLHDMWAFTGGCHYNEGCERFEGHCGLCPQLHNSGSNDLSNRIFARKKKSWRGVDMVAVAPSRWMAECAGKSALFNGRRVEVIPNGLDLEVYKPLNKLFAREVWNLPVDKKLILFGAINAGQDHRKGLDLLYKAIDRMKERWRDQVAVVVFGASDQDGVSDLSLPVHYVGNVHDDSSLALLYSTADVMVVSSRQDNLPNTAIESLACGTPLVAFDVGGMPDIVSHHQDGYLAQPYDTDDLAHGIESILSSEDVRFSMSGNARKKAVECFDVRVTAQRYIELYASLMK